MVIKGTRWSSRELEGNQGNSMLTAVQQLVKVRQASRELGPRAIDEHDAQHGRSRGGRLWKAGCGRQAVEGRL